MNKCVKLPPKLGFIMNIPLAEVSSSFKVQLRGLNLNSLLMTHEIPTLCSGSSVSPSPKKGHGKVAKKGHFITRGNMSKGHF